MTRTVGTLGTHWQGVEISVTTCLKIKTRTGVILAMTATDVPLPIDLGDGDGEITYNPSNALDATEITIKNDLKVSTVSFKSFLTEGDVSETDVLNGFYMGAEFTLFECNWKDPQAAQVILLTGELGEVNEEDFSWEAECRSLAAQLKQAGQIDTHFALCRHEFGSADCGFPLEPQTWTAGLVIPPATVNDQKAAVDGTVVATVYDERVYVPSLAGYGGDTEPTWNTTIGGTTVANAPVQIRWRPKTQYRASDGAGLFVDGRLTGFDSDEWYEPSEPGSTAPHWRPRQADTTVWTPNNFFFQRQWRKPTVDNGFVYFSENGGNGNTTGGTEPTWPTTELATVADGSVLWYAFDESLATFAANATFKQWYFRDLGGPFGPAQPQMVEFQARTAGNFSGTSHPFGNANPGATYTTNGVTFDVNEVPRVNDIGIVVVAHGANGGWITTDEPAWVATDDQNYANTNGLDWYSYLKSLAVAVPLGTNVRQGRYQGWDPFDSLAYRDDVINQVTVSGDMSTGGINLNRPTWNQTIGGTTVWPSGVETVTIFNSPAEWETLLGTYLEGTVNSVSNRRVINATGIVTTPAQPALFSKGCLLWLTGDNAGTYDDVEVDAGDGNIELMNDPDYQVQAGDTFRVFRGCFLDIFDCKNYRNVKNFGGFPTIPTEFIVQAYPVSNEAPREFVSWSDFFADEAGNGIRVNSEPIHQNWFL